MKKFHKIIAVIVEEEAKMIGRFQNSQLYIEIRPRCPKCKKEFMLDLKMFSPGRAHSCHTCGTITQFDTEMAERVQQLMHGLESSIRAIYQDISSDRTD